MIILQTRLIYSNRVVGKSIQLTILLEYVDLFCYMHLNKLIFAPHAVIISFYLYTEC